VLHGECASCHVTPTIGKTGGELFQTACLICHGAEQRASMVPDLKVAKAPRDAAYWEKWIREGGGEKTLMPAFDKARNGSLDEAQIKSLVVYLLATLPTRPPSN
jgi:mono/diheme cytochrome c family protein